MWEQNGMVYWPPDELQYLRDDPSSIPQPNWTQFRCKVKMDNINGLDEAQLWEDEFISPTTVNVSQKP